MTTYFTKCNRTFEKSTKAETTGYHIPEDESGQITDRECAACPFPIDVKEGWPDQVHKRWECRAGSQPPNHETTWQGSLKDKNRISVYSLDVAMMEEIRAYAQNHPDLSAAYNADSMADCRRTLSISCSSNKKGMAAKKELIDKFFPAQEATPDSTDDPEDAMPDLKEVSTSKATCENCANYDPTGKEVGTCEITGKPVSRVRPACDDYGPGDIDEGDDLDEEELDSMDLEDQLDTLLESGDKADKAGKANGWSCGDCPIGHSYSGKNTYVSVVQSDGITTIRRPVEPETHYCIDFTDDRRKIASDADFDPETAPTWCPREVPEQAESDLTRPIKFTALAAMMGQNETFDYSGLEKSVVETLHKVESEITRIKLNTVYDIGKYLAIANKALANHANGTFIAWVQSLGFNRQTAYNYIRAYEFICQHFDNVIDAESIQPSLLFAASKPSAPAELAQAVVDGDITKHKDYVEAMKRLKETEKKLTDAEFHLERVSTSYDHLEKVNTEHYEMSKLLEGKLKKANEALSAQQTIERDYRKRLEDVEQQREESAKSYRDASDQVQRLVNDQVDRNRKIFDLERQVEQMKQDSDPAKLKELEKEIAELREQLSAKPVTVTAEILDPSPEAPKAVYCPLSGSLCSCVGSNDPLTWDELERVEPGTPLYLIGLAPYANSGWILFNAIAQNGGSDGNRMSYRTSWGSGTLSSITHLTYSRGEHQFYRQKPKEVPTDED